MAAVDQPVDVWTTENVTVCRAFDAERNAPFARWVPRLPYLCDGVPVGVEDSWRGIFCSPFWDYRAMQLVLLFVSIWAVRLKAQGEIKKLLKGTCSRDFRSEVCCPGAALHLPGSKGSSYVSAASGLEDEPDKGCCVALKSALHKASAWVLDLLRRASSCTYGFLKLTTLQILQWWLLLIGVLIFMFFDELVDVYYFHRVRIQFSGPGGWRVVLPPEFDAIPRWLAMFSISSFVALLFVYTVSLWSIVLQVFTHFSLQVLRCNMFVAGSAMISRSRDVAIQVLLLPMVYSCLAAKSVTTTWSSMTGDFEPALQCFARSDAQKRQLLQDAASSAFMTRPCRPQHDQCRPQQAWEVSSSVLWRQSGDAVNTYFALADMYAAWALYSFGRMVAKVLQPDLRKKIRFDVVKAFESLLLIDVSVFVLVCAVGALYVIFLTWCKWRLGVDVCELYPFICSFQSYLTGANWCSSSIAIYNLYTMERKFALLPTMKHFGPDLKFWSIKLMVLVAFWMSFVVVIVRDVFHLTDSQSQLLDSSFRIYVMAIVAIMNLKAWWPWSQWYHHIDNGERRRASESGKPLLEVGVKHVPPGIAALVVELFGLGDKEAMEWECVERTIMEMGEEGLERALYRGSQIGWVVSGGPRPRKAMLEMPLENRRRALATHLKGFYPEV